MFPAYCKIHSVFKRTSRGLFIDGDWSRPEFGYLADCPWVWTEKVDGTNIRIGLDSDATPDPPDYTGPALRTFRIGGRTDRAQIPVTLLEAIGRLNLEPKMREQFPEGDVTLYGEGYGARIQKGGGNYRPDQGFVLFDVRCGRWWLQRRAVEEIAANLGINVVPLVLAASAGGVPLKEAVYEFGAWADASFASNDPTYGVQSRWGNFRAEGVVGTPDVPLFARDGSRVIVKLKHKDFDRLRREADHA